MVAATVRTIFEQSDRKAAQAQLKQVCATLAARFPKVVDLLTDAYYTWQGSRNYVQIDPHSVPAHVFVIRRHLRTEHDFDYFM